MMNARDSPFIVSMQTLPLKKAALLRTMPSDWKTLEGFPKQSYQVQ